MDYDAYVTLLVKLRFPFIWRLPNKINYMLLFRKLSL